MIDPDLRVVIDGVDVTQEALDLLLRQRAAVEALSERVLRRLEQLDQEIRRVEERVRRA